jgi:ATP-dependent Clp protease ATP-binding subunit ClpA
MGHSEIGSEHLLLGLLREQEGLAARVLESFSLDLEGARVGIVHAVGLGDEIRGSGQIPFTRRARRVLEAARTESASLGHDYVGTEHILLGLLRVGDSTGAKILSGAGVEAVAVRERIVSLLSGPGRRGMPASGYRSPIFERFTEPSRQVVVLAQDEARRLKHNYIGTEHILLGLLREEEGLAARVLESLGITPEEMRARVARIVGEGDEVASGQIPFTPRAKKVLELSLREALSLGHNYIGTEHILLGLVRENEGVAARILLEFDADAEKVRNEIIRTLAAEGHGGRTHPRHLSRFGFAGREREDGWEFRIEPVPGGSAETRVETLNALGRLGWRLAGVVPGPPSELIFQRRARDVAVPSRGPEPAPDPEPDDPAVPG